MIVAAIDVSDMDRYLQMLHTNETELALLAKDLLINVTSFFRDPSVFDLRNVSTTLRHPGSEFKLYWAALPSSFPARLPVFMRAFSTSAD
jgi:chemotaxis methyl-accepting protein methylase